MEEQECGKAAALLLLRSASSQGVGAPEQVADLRFEQRRNVVRCWTRMGVPMRAQVEVSLTVRKRRCSCSGPKYELEWQNLIRTVVRTSRK